MNAKTHKAHVAAALTLTALLLAPAASFAKVTADRDPNADFSAYSTYSWAEGTPIDNPLMEKRLRTAVDAELAALGYQKVASGADFTVSTHGEARVESRLNVHDNSLAYGWRPYRRYPYGSGPVTVTTQEVTHATLTVEIADAASGETLWLGTADGTPKASPEKNAAKILKVTARMFESLPPAS